jgi:hypothetical protein
MHNIRGFVKHEPLRFSGYKKKKWGVEKCANAGMRECANETRECFVLPALTALDALSDLKMLNS